MPAVAWLLPAVALPIIFHLFFRLRRQVREFPSLMFFVRIDPRLSSKRKIHEWLILFLRCLFLLLLLLALMRPILGTKGFSEPVARLVLIDNSGSMAALAVGGISKMTLAARAAAALLDTGHPGDSFSVRLMLPDPTSTLPDKFDAPPAAVRDALSKIIASDGAAPVARSIRLALAALDTAKAPRRELHIITDLQRKNWSRGELESEATNCRIVVHRIESETPKSGSVSIEVTNAQTREIPAGHITPMRFALHNNSPFAAHVRVNSLDDSGKSSLRQVDVAPNVSTLGTLTFSFPNPGFHWAHVWLEGDAAPSASRAELGFFCTNVRQMVFVGARGDFGAMPYAVSPGGNANLSGVDSIYAAPDRLETLLSSKPLAVAFTWDNLPPGEAPALEGYIRQGGTVFILPPPDSAVSISRTIPDWIGAVPGSLVKAPAPEPIVLLRESDSLWQDLRDNGGQPQLGVLRDFQYLPLKLNGDWQTLITSAKGSPLLARRAWDRGEIYAAGLAFTPKWSSLPLKAGFVVLVQNALFSAKPENLPVRSILAGEDFRFDMPGAPVSLRSLAGAPLEWQGEAGDFAGFPHSGVYEASQRNHVSWVAVSGNADEADSLQLPLAPVPLLHNLPHDIVPLVHPDDITHTSTLPGSGASLYRWFFLTSMLVLVVETWLANERSGDLGRKLFASLRLSPQKHPEAKPKEFARR